MCKRYLQKRTIAGTCKVFHIHKPVKARNMKFSQFDFPAGSHFRRESLVTYGTTCVRVRDIKPAPSIDSRLGYVRGEITCGLKTRKTNPPRNISTERMNEP